MQNVHIDVVFRHSTFKVVQFFNHLTSLCKYSLKKSFRYYILLLCPIKVSYKVYTQKGFYMWIADNWKDYEVLDTSSGEKLERWGDYILVRPDPQVIWKTPHDHKGWKQKNGHYRRKPPVRLIL